MGEIVRAVVTTAGVVTVSSAVAVSLTKVVATGVVLVVTGPRGTSAGGITLVGGIVILRTA